MLICRCLRSSVGKGDCLDEIFVLLRERVVVYTYNDNGSVLESAELNPNKGRYGVNIPNGGVAFSCKPFWAAEKSGEYYEL